MRVEGLGLGFGGLGYHCGRILAINILGMLAWYTVCLDSCGIGCQGPGWSGFFHVQLGQKDAWHACFLLFSRYSLKINPKP